MPGMPCMQWRILHIIIGYCDAILIAQMVYTPRFSLVIEVRPLFLLLKQLYHLPITSTVSIILMAMWPPIYKVVLALSGVTSSVIFGQHTMPSHLKSLINYGSTSLQDILQPKLILILSYFLPVNDGLGHGYLSNLLQGYGPMGGLRLRTGWISW